MKITIENEVYDITNDTITFGHPTTKEHFVKMIERACDMFLDYQLTSAKCEFNFEKKYFETEIVMSLKK